MNDYDYLIKTMIIGDSMVGKSSILSRFVDKDFDNNSCPTIGVDFKIKTIKLDNGKIVKMQIWDTAGHERFRSITNSYYRGANIILLVYDITNTRSFENINIWLKDIERYCNSSTKKILIGNKYDLRDVRQVSVFDAQIIAERNNMNYIETSAKNSYNIEKAFHDISKEYAQNIKPINQNNNKISRINIFNNPKNSSHCYC